MKNLKINKTFLALGMACTIPLMTSCGHNTNDVEETSSKTETHTHIYVNVGDEVIVFKECEGYKLTYTTNVYSGLIYIDVKDMNNNVLLNVKSTNYIKIETDDMYTNSIDEMLENNENVKVYTLDK